MPVTVRPRIGLIVPSTQVITEPLFNRVAGSDWDFVTSRVLLRGSGPNELEEMETHIPRAVEELTSARVDAIVSCCTASGAIHGLPRDQQMCDQMTATAGMPVTSTMLSILANLRHLRANRIVLVTPYQADLALIEHRYFADNGLAVVGRHDGEISDPFAMSQASTESVVDAAARAWTDAADVTVLSCMNWPTHEAATRICEKTQAPVVTSHSATLWNLQRILAVATSRRRSNERSISTVSRQQPHSARTITDDSATGRRRW